MLTATTSLTNDSNAVERAIEDYLLRLFVH